MIRTVIQFLIRISNSAKWFLWGWGIGWLIGYRLFLSTTNYHHYISLWKKHYQPTSNPDFGKHCAEWLKFAHIDKSKHPYWFSLLHLFCWHLFLLWSLLLGAVAYLPHTHTQKRTHSCWYWIIEQWATRTHTEHTPGEGNKTPRRTSCTCLQTQTRTCQHKLIMARFIPH